MAGTLLAVVVIAAAAVLVLRDPRPRMPSGIDGHTKVADPAEGGTPMTDLLEAPSAPPPDVEPPSAAPPDDDRAAAPDDTARRPVVVARAVAPAVVPGVAADWSRWASRVPNAGGSPPSPPAAPAPPPADPVAPTEVWDLHRLPDAPATRGREHEAVAPAPYVDPSVLAHLGAEEIDGGVPLWRRMVALATLLLLTLITASAVAGGIWWLVHSVA